MRLQKTDLEGYWMQEADTSAASLSGDDAVDKNVPAPKMSQEEMLKKLECLRREQQLLQRVAISRKRKSEVTEIIDWKCKQRLVLRR